MSLFMLLILFPLYIYMIGWSGILWVFALVFGVGIGISDCAKPSKLSKLIIRTLKPDSSAQLDPIGENQFEYCQLLADKGVSVLAGIGPAGCGKTAFACQAAIKSLFLGEVDRVVLTRPLVSVDEELGFLPGTMERKMDPWVRPMMDILKEFYSGSEIRRLMDEGIIEISPLAYMRGRTFRRSFLIADEMQNSSPNQMLMMSRLVITGDLLQSDRSGVNGLADFYGRLSKQSYDSEIRYVQFEVNDVQRSSVVASILRLYSSDKSNSFSSDAAIIPKHLDRYNSENL